MSFSTDKLKCPYCHYKQEVPDWDDPKGVKDCERCKKLFIYEVENIEYTFFNREINEVGK